MKKLKLLSVVAALVVSNTNAALPPQARNLRDINAMLDFAESQEMTVLFGLKRINVDNNTVVYRGYKNSKNVENCIVRFKRKPVDPNLTGPQGDLIFKSSTCDLDQKYLNNANHKKKLHSSKKVAISNKCDKTILYCTTKFNKLIKVCKNSTGYLYQFGKVGKKPDVFLKRSHKDVIKTPKSAVPASIGFVDRDKTYSVFSFSGRPNKEGLTAGVIIKQTGKKSTTIKCHPDDIQTDKISLEMK